MYSSPLRSHVTCVGVSSSFPHHGPPPPFNAKIDGPPSPLDAWCRFALTTPVGPTAYTS
jgi:hypothetical protein